MAAHASSGGTNGLFAVLLITRSRPGPKLVFHWPPVPEIKDQSGKSKQIHHDYDDLSDCEPDSDLDRRACKQQPRQRGESNSTVRHVATGEDVSQDPLDQVVGVDIESLEKLLAPGRWSAKKKFEVCLDSATYVGLPMYAREDGSGWSKRGEPATSQKQARKEPSSSFSLRGDQEDIDKDEATTGSVGAGIAGITITKPDHPAPPPLLSDYTHMPDSLDSSNLASLGTSMNSTSTTSAVVSDQMSMFHVVFALSLPIGQKSLKSTELYEHVAVKLSKALKYCQKQSNYVTSESRKLQNLKTKGRLDKLPHSTMWMRMIEHSELAWALKETFERLSINKTATIRLDGQEISLQLPPRSSVSTPELSLSCALLLLEDKDTLLQSLTHPSSTLLAYFIRETLPTKTLAKQAAKLGIPEKTISYLAEHLIKWRKARAISVLHPRNTYVVTPEAPLERLAELREAYARRFPALPGLDKMLAMLGGKPIRFGALIQSSAHRASYVEILAWLARFEFVVQLKTFGWLRLAPSRPHGAENTSQNGATAAGKGAVSRSDETSAQYEHENGDSARNGHAEATSSAQLGIVVDPLLPSSAGQTAIRRMQTAVEKQDLGHRFQSLLKYFDGEHAFEEIAAEEGVKRARVEEILGELEQIGWLVTFRAC